MILQLNPPLHMMTTKGAGYAHFLIDYSQEDHLYWCVFMDEGGACWVMPNNEITLSENWTMGRR